MRSAKGIDVRAREPIANQSGQISTSEKIAYYRPELDALRFFAFLCVFSFHRMDYVPTDPVLHPWLYRIGNVGPFGVPVFFLLSAFLITELLLCMRYYEGIFPGRALSKQV